MSTEKSLIYSTLEMKAIMNQTDTLPVRRPIPDWIATRYSPEDPDMALVPRPILDWAVSHMVRYWQAAPEEDLEDIQRKIETHTPGVLHAGMNIARNTPEVAWNFPQAACSLLLHDEARPVQFYKKRTYKDDKSWEHARVGAHMIEKARLPFKAYGIEEARVLDAVADHSLRRPPYRDQYLLLTRDADKDIILKEFLAALERRHQKGMLTFQPQLSEGIVRSFLHGENGNNKDVKTVPDEMLQKLSWMFDLNFPASVRQIVEAETPQKILEYLRMYTNVPAEVEEQVMQWCAL